MPTPVLAIVIEFSYSVELSASSIRKTLLYVKLGSKEAGGGDDTFRLGLPGINARLILLALILWVLVSMVLPRRNLILQIDLPPRPPSEQIEPNFWL